MARLSDEETLLVQETAQRMYIKLSESENQTMSLADFTDELRESSLQPTLIDEILHHMLRHNWVALWRQQGQRETWISVAYDEGED